MSSNINIKEYDWIRWVFDICMSFWNTRLRIKLDTWRNSTRHDHTQLHTHYTHTHTHTHTTHTAQSKINEKEEKRQKQMKEKLMEKWIEKWKCAKQIKIIDEQENRHTVYKQTTPQHEQIQVSEQTAEENQKNTWVLWRYPSLFKNSEWTPNPSLVSYYANTITPVWRGEDRTNRQTDQETLCHSPTVFIHSSD